jgi:hypothetical protein
MYKSFRSIAELRKQVYLELIKLKSYLFTRSPFFFVTAWDSHTVTKKAVEDI